MQQASGRDDAGCWRRRHAHVYEASTTVCVGQRRTAAEARSEQWGRRCRRVFEVTTPPVTGEDDKRRCPMGPVMNEDAHHPRQSLGGRLPCGGERVHPFGEMAQ